MPMVRMRKIGSALIGVLSMFGLGMTGCSRVRDNPQVALDVQNRIRADRRLLMARIQVRASQGIVTLSGFVGTGFQRFATVQDAAQIQGVKVVVDNLQVTDPNRGEPTMAVQKPQASVSRFSNPPKAPTIRRADASHAALPTNNPHPPAVAETIGASSSSNATPSPGDVAAAVSVDMHSMDSTAPGMSASALPASPPLVVTPPRAPEQVTVPYGTALAVRLTESLSSDLNQTGDTFLASLASPIVIGDRVVIPAEATLQGKIVDLGNAGRVSGRSALVIEVTRLAYNGRTYELRSSQYSKLGPSRNARAAAAIGGSAGVGAIIGAILGGGKGAAIGAMIGAGAGTGVQAATKVVPVQLRAEYTLSFRLESPLAVVPSSTLQQAQGTGPGSPQDPFSADDRPVLKRRPGSPPLDDDTHPPSTNSPSHKGSSETPWPQPPPN
jgi:hypothetical protein